MQVPTVDHGEAYVGLYVVELDGQMAVGVTPAEVAELLESEANRHAKLFRVRRALPNGQIELVGVHTDRFQLESGLFFFHAEENAARADFEHIRHLASERGVPGRAKLQLARQQAAAAGTWCTALIYPAEYDDAWSEWLLRAQFAGGQLVEGGVSAVSDFYASAWEVIASDQLAGHSADSRPLPAIIGELRGLRRRSA